MLTIYGGSVECSPGRVRLVPNTLRAALGYTPQELDVDSTMRIGVVAPTTAMGGAVTITQGDALLRLDVPPNAQKLCDELVTRIRRSAEASSESQAHPDVDPASTQAAADDATAVLVAPEYAHGDPASLQAMSACTVSLVADGTLEFSDATRWEVDPTDPVAARKACATYIGSHPLLAYNAELLVIGLRTALTDDHWQSIPLIAGSPECPLGCLLALQRQAGADADGRSAGESPVMALSLEDSQTLLSALVERTPALSSASTGAADDASHWVDQLFRRHGLWLGQSRWDGTFRPCLDCAPPSDPLVARERPAGASESGSDATPARADAGDTFSQDEDASGSSGGRGSSKKGSSRRRRGSSGGAGQWSRVATPTKLPKPREDADPAGPLYGKLVVLTGDFTPHDKGALWDAMAYRGATVQKNVTLKTTLLVIGEWGSMTSKEKKAREYIERGQPIALWPAEKLYAVLGIDDESVHSDEPPF